MTDLWPIATAVSTAAAVGLLVLFVRSRRAAQRSRDAVDATWQERYTSQAASWHDDVARRDRALSDQEARWQDVLDEAAATHDEEIERIRRWAATGLRWERTSRDFLIEQAESHGHEGFLATNVCFHVTDVRGTFVHQIDHLLVSQHGIVAIEVKNWDGLIFHGVAGKMTAFQAQIERFGPLEGLATGVPYVVHVRADRPPTIVRADEAREPTKQVRLQAQALRSTLAESSTSGAIPFINTCVLYSHERSVLVGGMLTIERTPIVDRNSIGHVLGGRTNTCADSVVREVAEWSILQGADLYGLGRFQDTWRSVFPR